MTLLPLINAIGSFLSAAYLAYAMRHTTGDDRCASLIRFEWVFLAMLLITAIDQLRLFFTGVGVEGAYSPIGYTLIWVSAMFFGRHLQLQYK